MTLTKDQQFTDIIWFLLNNGEDFRIMYDGGEWMNIEGSVYCNGMLVTMFECQAEESPSHELPYWHEQAS